MTADELDELLRDRFDLERADLIAALKTLHAHRPWSATLNDDDARLLDSAGLPEDRVAYAEVAADVTVHMARLFSTAYAAAEVADGLGVSASRIRQRRLNYSLWAIDDGGSWVYPAVQFDLADDGPGTPLAFKQVRGLDQVLPQLLTSGLHPAAVASFLLAPQHDLLIDGRRVCVREWLLHGEPTAPVLNIIDIGEWASM